MKLSKLIIDATKIMSEHGDLDVIVAGNILYDAEPDENIEMVPKSLDIQEHPDGTLYCDIYAEEES